VAEREAARRPSRAALVFYGACRVVAVGLSRALFPGRVVGLEQLPKRGPYILAPVHRSNIDWLVVARLTRRRFRYIVKAEVWRAGPVGRFIELLGAFPVHREAADRESLQRCLAVLAGGEPLVLFPEGTRREGVEVTDLREGAAYLALRAGVPIVPVGLAGTDRAMPRGAKRFHPTHVMIVVGAPLNATAPVAAGEGRTARVPRSANSALTEELRVALERVLANALALDRLRRGSGVASTAVAAPPRESSGGAEPPGGGG